MNTSLSKTTLVAALALAALSLGGCATSTADDSAGQTTASPAPTATEPPSTPLAETTLVDAEDGTEVTPLAIVTDFPSPEGFPDGVHPILVKVRMEPGDKFDGTVFPTVVSITPRDVNLDMMMLGGSNPETLTGAMAAAGYTPLGGVERGETATAWIGAWTATDVTEFDLVYDRPEGKTFGTESESVAVPASRSIVPLTLE
jgi:hypothetical protein